MADRGKRCPHFKPPASGMPWFEWTCSECQDSGVRMRALSLHDPYPWLILDLPDEHHKNIENRQRSMLSATGPLLVHVAKSATRPRHEEALKLARRCGVPDSLLPAFGARPLMGIVGCVNVSQKLPPHSMFDALYRWKFPTHVGYVLNKRVKLPFRGMAGGQGVFHVDLTREEEQIVRRAGMF